MPTAHDRLRCAFPLYNPVLNTPRYIWPLSPPTVLFAPPGYTTSAEPRRGPHVICQSHTFPTCLAQGAACQRVSPKSTVSRADCRPDRWPDRSHLCRLLLDAGSARRSRAADRACDWVGAAGSDAVRYRHRPVCHAARHRRRQPGRAGRDPGGGNRRSAGCHAGHRHRGPDHGHHFRYHRPDDAGHRQRSCWRWGFSSWAA